MVEVEPFTLQKCTAFKERLQIVDKLNEIIHVLRNVPDDTETRLNEQDAKIDTFIEDTSQEITDFETSVNDEIDTFETTVNDEIETFKTSVNTEINTFKTFVNNEIDTFESTVNTEINTFETTVNNSLSAMQTDITDFKSSVNAEITRFEAYINTEISNFESDVNDSVDDLTSAFDTFKSAINTAISTFETNINTEVSTFESTVNTSITDMESDIQDMQTDISTFKTTVNNAISTFETNVNSAISTFESTVNGQITQMQSDISDMQTDISTFKSNIETRVTSVESLVSSLQTLVNTGTYSNVDLSNPVNGTYTLTFTKHDGTTQAFNILIKDIKTITSSQSGNTITLTITYSDNTTQTLTFNIDLSNYVTLDTEQSITGNKNFNFITTSNAYINQAIQKNFSDYTYQIFAILPNIPGFYLLLCSSYGHTERGLAVLNTTASTTNPLFHWIYRSTQSSDTFSGKMKIVYVNSKVYILCVSGDSLQRSISFIPSSFRYSPTKKILINDDIDVYKCNIDTDTQVLVLSDGSSLRYSYIYDVETTS